MSDSRHNDNFFNQINKCRVIIKSNCLIKYFQSYTTKHNLRLPVTYFHAK